MSTARGGAIDRMTVTDALTTAISMGAPTYNMGDHRGCYDVYRRTAQSIVNRPMLANTDREVIAEGMRRAEMSS